MSFITTAPAPTVTLLPILIPSLIIAPAPINEQEPTKTFPHITAPGPT